MTVDPSTSFTPRWCVLGTVAAARVAVVDIDARGRAAPPKELARQDLAGFVRDREAAGRPRWVWSDTSHWLPRLLDSGVRVERCHDLRLSHAILRRSELASASESDRAAILAAEEWDAEPGEPDPEPRGTALFDLDDSDHRHATVPHQLTAATAEFERQRAAMVGRVGDAGARLQLLIAAESAGAIVAAELRAAGVPWDAEEHHRILTEALGPRPQNGAKPAKMVDLAREVANALGERHVSIDSPPQLLRALRNAGLDVKSTSQWELAEHEHPVIEPLLQYKKLARLLSANGWVWIDDWVRDGRYRPLYIPGGVVTGRWASSGGGALQIPRQLRPVIHADPGWTLVSADVSQLEPRVLAAMSQDARMAAAAHGKDLYAGIVESGVVETRQEAKIAVLGAMYGSTSGDSGRLVPRLRRSFPRAMQMVDEAAVTGERGGVVSTWLGRSSPAPDPEWVAFQARANQVDADPADGASARRAAREMGRFTRNFIVQGTAAEWALAWMADLRLRLERFPEAENAPSAHSSGPVFALRAHLVFFLHDEIIVHTPIEQAEAAAEAVIQAATAAGALLFGSSPVDFPLDIHVSERAAKA